VLLSPVVDGRSILLLALVVVWASPLGSFLFRRIRKAGKDTRFDEIKPSFIRFLNTWTLQGLWVTFHAGAALAAITTTTRKELDVFAASASWSGSSGLPPKSQRQPKERFRADPKNKGKFIHTGLWAWSRHPNYFGEIVLWVGVAIIALPSCGAGMGHLISPVFVALLISRISGVPLLEKQADERWAAKRTMRLQKNAPRC